MKRLDSSGSVKIDEKIWLLAVVFTEYKITHFQSHPKIEG